MDQTQVKQKAGKLAKQIGWGLGGLFALVLTVKAGAWLSKSLGIGTYARKVAIESEELIGHPWDSVQAKVDQLARAIDDNERLRLENAHLKLRVESLQFDCQAKRAETTTRNYGLKLDPQTGSRVGRTLASIGYRIPDQLSPEQLFVLGVSYFQGKEFEKSAALLTFLANLENNAKFKNPRTWMMAGVSWYRLDNFEMAGPYFDKTIAAASKDEQLHSYHAQALLWKALTAERTGKKTKAQFWVRELLDHHPHSREAQWVNGRGGRLPAAHKEAPEHGEHAAAAHHGEHAEHAAPAQHHEHVAPQHETHAEPKHEEHHAPAAEAHGHH